jgi:hypothetical protein
MRLRLCAKEETTMTKALSLALFGMLLGLAACTGVDNGRSQTAGMPSGGGAIGPQTGTFGSSAGAWGYQGSVGRGRGQTGAVPTELGTAPGFTANGKVMTY